MFEFVFLKIQINTIAADLPWFVCGISLEGELVGGIPEAKRLAWGISATERIEKVEKKLERIYRSRVQQTPRGTLDITANSTDSCRTGRPPTGRLPQAGRRSGPGSGIHACTVCRRPSDRHGRLGRRPLDGRRRLR